MVGRIYVGDHNISIRFIYYDEIIFLNHINIFVIHFPFFSNILLFLLSQHKLKPTLAIHSSFAITLMGKRELVALLSLSSWCLVMVEWLFLALPWGCLKFLIVVFPDHTHSF